MQAKIRSVTIHRRFASGDTDSCSDLFGVRHLPFTFVIFVSTVLYLYIPNPLGTMTQESSQVAPRYLTGDKAGLQEFLAKFDVFLFDCDGISPCSTSAVPPRRSPAVTQSRRNNC